MQRALEQMSLKDVNIILFMLFINMLLLVRLVALLQIAMSRKNDEPFVFVLPHLPMKSALRTPDCLF